MWETKKIKVYNKGDVILDTYLVEDIRSGGMGHVYIAYHKKWKLKVALGGSVMISGLLWIWRYSSVTGWSAVVSEVSCTPGNNMPESSTLQRRK